MFQAIVMKFPPQKRFVRAALIKPQVNHSALRLKGAQTLVQQLVGAGTLKRHVCAPIAKPVVPVALYPQARVPALRVERDHAQLRGPFQFPVIAAQNRHFGRARPLAHHAREQANDAGSANQDALAPYAASELLRVCAVRLFIGVEDTVSANRPHLCHIDAKHRVEIGGEGINSSWRAITV